MGIVNKLLNNKKDRTREMEIWRYFEQGFFSFSAKDKRLLRGFLQMIKELEQAGFVYNEIIEIGLLGQTESNSKSLSEIKQDLENGEFKGGLDAEHFDITKSYVDYTQIILDNGEVYVVAGSSPSDYFGTLIGVLWKIKLPRRIDVGKLPGTELMFKK